jgi:hypothetical protein
MIIKKLLIVIVSFFYVSGMAHGEKGTINEPLKDTYHLKGDGYNTFYKTGEIVDS